MPHSFNETLLKAARMTRNGHLMDATRLIQQALAGVAASTPPSTRTSPTSARAANDGYSLFMGAVHHTIAPSMYPRLDYDLEKDFVPLTVVASDR